MKVETLVMKIIQAVETDSPTVITFNGGFIFSLPLIFAGITAAATVVGATAAGVKTSNAKKADVAKAAATKAAEEKKAAEEHRHNLALEKLAAEVKKPKTEKKGSGVGDMIGTMKECGKRFSEETKKTVKQGLNKLLDSIDTGEIKVKHKVPEQSYYQFLKALEYLPKKDVQDLFQYYEGEVDIKDIIDNYIEGKKPTDIKVFLTKNVNDLDLSNIDSKRKNLILFDDCVAQRNQAVQQEFFTKGRHRNCHCIYQSQSFYGMDSMFIRKNANCFLLFELNDKDLSQIIQSINHGMDRDAFKKVCKANGKTQMNMDMYL
ncbi:hypothetical protein LOTGIDRAFT_165391 [Lottia gigantea]|uniref:Uncharacterized protein n=1 Tax=Lottia gigantea TaxID=225164 RepID=V3ZW51_LOTGI|nr:hypothetical protein LOTGIDRAFT_165391 [Lottia gigantea]ESO88607.1 hypothetical protein LOTGIDRAFT_165391 [Lottia gigantea]